MRELTFEQCAEDAKVSTKTVRRWARLKRFKVTTYTRKTKRVPSSSWEAFKERLTK
jgi:predicted DNA-binding protein (UPF0251 family)